MRTIIFNQSNQGTLDFQTNQQDNTQKPAEDEIEQFENGKIRSSQWPYLEDLLFQENSLVSSSRPDKSPTSSLLLPPVLLALCYLTSFQPPLLSVNFSCLPTLSPLPQNTSLSPSLTILCLKWSPAGENIPLLRVPHERPPTALSKPPSKNALPATCPPQGLLRNGSLKASQGRQKFVNFT